MARVLRRSVLRSWAAALAVHAGLARAEPPRDPCAGDKANSKECEPIELVVTGTRTPQSTQRATVRTDVVIRDEAERRGATNVGEALAGETTLQVNPEAYGDLGGPSGVQIQGLDGDRVLILEDGERVIGDTGGVVDLASLPLVDVDRIEYVAGPTSSLYGSNALGGVINVISAAPSAYGPSVRYRLEGRSSSEYLGSASNAYRDNDTWAALDVAYHYRPEIRRDQSRPDLLRGVWRSREVGVRAGLRPFERTELRLKARWLRDDTQGLESETVPGLGTFLLDLPKETNRYGLRAQETIELRGGVRLDLSLAQNWFVEGSERDRRDSPVDEERERRLYDQALEAVVTVADGEQRTWVLGVRSESEQFSQQLERTLPNLMPQDVQELDPMLLSSAALFAQLGWQLGERWTVMPGVRGEVHDRYGSIVAPRLAAAFQWTEWLGLRAQLGRGFRAPTAKEFGFEFDHSAIGYRVIGNPDLEAETSWGLSGDATARSTNFRLRVGAFYNFIDELITLGLAPEQPVTGVATYMYRNIADARTAGADVSVRTKIASIVSVDAGYAYLWTRDLGEDQPLPRRPPHTATLGLLAELGKVTPSLRYKIVTSAFMGELNGERLSSPTYGLLDLRMGYGLLPELEAFVGVLNLTDEKRDPLDPADIRPALGRQFYLGVRGELPAEE
jgi:outer membrane receptor for ferrienterochelin and colicins